MHDKRRELLRALLAAPCAFLPTLAAAAPRKGDALRLPELPLIEGGAFKPDEVEGRVVMVYWWASWCPFCREMTPHVEKLWREQRERGLYVLGVSIDKTVEAAASHRRKLGYTFPCAMYQPAMEPAMPKPKTIPTTWVRDRQGRVVMAATGQLFPEDVADIAKFL